MSTPHQRCPLPLADVSGNQAGGGTKNSHKHGENYSGTKQMKNSSEINENPNHWLILSSSSRLWTIAVFFTVLLCSCGSRKKDTVPLFPEQTAWHSWTPSSMLTCPLHRLENFNKRDQCFLGGIFNVYIIFVLGRKTK